MPDIIRPMSLDRSPMYDGTQHELERQAEHGQALMTVVRAARRYIRSADDPSVDMGRAYLNLANTLAALDAVEER